MHRRSLLQGMAAVAALRPTALLARAARKGAAVLSRVRPGDAAWPSAAQWQTLKDTVGGNLIDVHPLFAACEADAKSAACADVIANMRNPIYIGDQPGGTQVSGWLDAWMPQPSVYAVKARNAADVAAAVNFAREKNLRLVVKGGAHSYLGTSSAPDSLMIWTRALRDVALHDAFVPQGCDGKVAPSHAVSAGAGCMWIDLYDAVTTKAGRYVQGGGCTTVGVAGLVQGGGFGSFSKGFGTVASHLLEAEIVTADGKVRIVNACNDPALFFALKGGGGGSFGVVTRVTLKTHDLPEHFGAAWGTVKANNDEAFKKLVAKFISFYTANLFNPHWGEQAYFNQDNSLRLSFVCQGLDGDQIKAAWTPFFDWAKAQPDLAITEDPGSAVAPAQHWWDAPGRRAHGNDAMIADTRAGAPAAYAWWKGDQDQVGAFLHGYDSLWLPQSLLQPAQQQTLCDAIFAASRHKDVEFHFNKGLAGATPEAIAAARDTAMNPAVTDAFALVLIADGEMPDYPGFPRPKPLDENAARKDARAIDAATAEFRKIAPDAGTYVNETNFFNDNWQHDYWGENHAHLEAAKKQYDPAGLFFVHHGVGSEAWSADGFTRLR
ncbi:MAG TPA: FAD-binding protein [Rhizomicrobium sp.]|nr:FAD-binding protein [Rhizomicrobium sp.]